MKNFRRTLLAFCLAVLLLVGVVFTVIATTEAPEYTGDMATLTTKVAEVETQVNTDPLKASRLKKALTEVSEYLAATPVDPATEGYAEAMAKVYSAAVVLANHYMPTDPTAAYKEIEDGLVKAEEIIALFPDIDTTAPDFVAYAENVLFYANTLAERYLTEVETAISSDAVTVEVVASFHAAEAVVAKYELSETYGARLSTGASALVDALFAHASESGVSMNDASGYLASAKPIIEAYGMTDKGEQYDLTVFNIIKNGYEAIEPTKDADGFWNADTATAQLNQVKAFMSSNPVNESIEGAAELVEGINALTVTLAEKRDENLAKLDDRNALSVYGEAFAADEDFSSFNVGDKVEKAFNTFNGPTVYGGSYFVVGGDDTNKYLSIVSDTAAGGTYISYSFSKMNNNPTANGFIIEFKAKADLGHTDGRLSVEPGGYGESGSRFFPTKYFEVGLADGTLKPGENDKSGFTLTGALSADEWTHFLVRFDPEEFKLYLYCNGVLQTSFDAKYNGKTFDYSDSTGHGMRIVVYGNDAVAHIDDIKVYTGLNYRNPDKFNEMTEAELFLYYANYAADSARDPAGRSTAYERATALLEKFYVGGDYATEDEQIIAAIDKYLDIDPQYIATLVATSNRDTFIEMVQKLDNMERTAASLADRTLEYTKITEFIVTTAGKIDANDDYQQWNTYFSSVLSREITIDTNIVTFNKAMERFDMVDALGGKQKYYNKAKSVVEDPTYPINEFVYNELKYVYDEDGDMVLDEDGEPVLSTAFEEFVAAYDKYSAAGETVEAMERDEESRKIISCVGFIEQYDTEQEWIDNYDYINRYVTILRDTVNKGYYNADFEGVEEALQILAPIETWFYSQLQNQHAETVRDALDKIAANDSYIVKMGLCSYLERYLADPTVDKTYGDMPLLMVEFATHQQELEYREADYAELLVQNAYYFKSLVDTLVLSESYADIKYYYDQAYNYYFSIDAAVEGVAERIEIFDRYTDIVDLAEGASKAFKECVVALEVAYADENATDEDIYYALAECYSYIEDIKTDIEGVESALEIYTEIAEEYIAEISENNYELYAAITMAGSLRADTEVGSIISVALKFVFD